MNNEKGKQNILENITLLIKYSNNHPLAFHKLKRKNFQNSVVTKYPSKLKTNTSLQDNFEEAIARFKQVLQSYFTFQELTNFYHNLASLEVEGLTLSPEFNSDTTNYSVEAEAGTTSVTVNAKASDSKASITGTGDVEIHEGANTINVVVEAENGSTKTYTIVVNVKEKDPINVKVNKDNLSVIRKTDELKDLIKDYYVDTTVKINDEEVPAYKIEALDITLVALKDEKGNIKFYIYDDGDYTLYQELGSDLLTIHLLDNGKIPPNYKKYTVNIDGEEYTVYKLNKKSKYYLVYGENVETGKKGLYLYDSVDKTIQRYYTEEVDSLKDELTINSYIIVGLTCLIVLLLIIFLIALHTKNNDKRRKKKELKKRLKQEKNDFLKD